MWPPQFTVQHSSVRNNLNEFGHVKRENNSWKSMWHVSLLKVFVEATSIFMHVSRFFSACHFNCLYFAPLNNPNLSLRFLLFRFYKFIFSSKQIQKNNKATVASVFLSRPANVAHFSQTHYLNHYITNRLKNTWKKLNASLCLNMHKYITQTHIVTINHIKAPLGWF